jgi:putative Mn2+ efflux pump MntP
MNDSLLSLGELLLLALALAMDVFTISLGIGTSGHARSFRPALRLSFHLGLFQGLMTLLGWGAGFGLARILSGVDHWVALALLSFVGVRMIRSGLSDNESHHVADPTRGGMLVLLSVATSIDAFAVGLTLAFLGSGVVTSAAVIGFVSLAMGLVGLALGGRLGARFGRRMEALGGALLIGIGLRVVITHLA